MVPKKPKPEDKPSENKQLHEHVKEQFNSPLSKGCFLVLFGPILAWMMVMRGCVGCEMGHHFRRGVEPQVESKVVDDSDKEPTLNISPSEIDPKTGDLKPLTEEEMKNMQEWLKWQQKHHPETLKDLH